MCALQTSTHRWCPVTSNGACGVVQWPDIIFQGGTESPQSSFQAYTIDACNRPSIWH